MSSRLCGFEGVNELWVGMCVGGVGGVYVRNALGKGLLVTSIFEFCNVVVYMVSF